MARPSITVGLLGVGEHERRVLLAAISAVSGPALLPADLQWTKVDDAAIVIADIDHPLTTSTLDGLQQLRAREVIRFAAQLRTDVDIARPIRMQALIAVLHNAMQAALLRTQRDAQIAATQAGSRRTYRGVAVEAPAAPADATEPTAEAMPKPRRTYRGQSY
jgi:hypothetical protein